MRFSFKNLFTYSNHPYVTRWAFFAPTNWKINCVNSKLYQFIYLFSRSYYFILIIEKKGYRLSLLNGNCVSITSNNWNRNFFFNWILIKKLFSKFNSPFFIKIKFIGKGYYIYKNVRFGIRLRFGFAHRVYLYSKFVSLLITSKKSLIIFGINTKQLFDWAYLFYWKKPLNIYTGRGVRFNRQIIYKKTGKVSEYR